MDIQIGPHWYRNTDGTIEIEGVPQIEIEYRNAGGPPRINFAIFDTMGKMPGKLLNSTLAINEGGAYIVTKNDSRLVVRTRDKEQEILNMEFCDDRRVIIARGEFFSLKGHPVKITPEEWSIEKATGKEGETDMKGKPVNLG